MMNAIKIHLIISSNLFTDSSKGFSKTRDMWQTLDFLLNKKQDKTKNLAILKMFNIFQILWDFEIQTNQLFLVRMPDLAMINKEKILTSSKFCSSDGPQGENKKESKKIDKYLDLARELKKLWNMKVTMILVVIRALGTVFKDKKRQDKLEIKERMKTIWTTALLRVARILRRVLETIKPPANAGVKNLIIIIIRRNLINWRL